jgi:hypothetical protein
VPFYIFSTGSGLMVIGFTCLVISATAGLTKIVSAQARMQYIRVGIVSAAVGLVIVFISFKDTGNERDTMMTTGGNIAALGIAALIQSNYHARTQKILKYSTLAAIIVGFLLCITYEMFAG